MFNSQANFWDFNNIFPFQQWDDEREKFHHDVRNKFSFGDIFHSTLFVRMYMAFIMFHVEPIFSCFNALNCERKKKEKKISTHCTLFPEAFWFIIKEEKLNNSELIKWFKALISFMFLRLFCFLSTINSFKLRRGSLRLFRAKYYSIISDTSSSLYQINREKLSFGSFCLHRFQVFIKLNSNISNPIELNVTVTQKLW